MTQLIRRTPHRWPYSLGQLRTDEPSRSFSSSPSPAELAEYDVFPVQPTPQPTYNPATERIEETTPVLVDTTWTQQWQTVPLTDAEQAAYYRATHPPRWVEFAAAAWAQPSINALLAAGLQSAPALAMALPVGLSKASDGDSRAFLSAWQQARDLGLATSEQAELLQQLAVAHDLPPEFCAAINRVRARNPDGTYRADDPATPDVNEAWEPAS